MAAPYLSSARWFQMAVAVDQLLNACAGGWADETLSARAWRNREQPKWRRFMRAVDAAFLLLGQREHCRLAAEFEATRFSLAPEFRQKGPAP